MSITTMTDRELLQYASHLANKIAEGETYYQRRLDAAIAEQVRRVEQRS